MSELQEAISDDDIDIESPAVVNKRPSGKRPSA